MYNWNWVELSANDYSNKEDRRNVTVKCIPLMLSIDCCRGVLIRCWQKLLYAIYTTVYLFIEIKKS